MNEDGPERFGVVGFKALDHEFDRCVVLRIHISMCVEIHNRTDETYHVRQRKVGHIENDGLSSSAISLQSG